MEYRIIKDAEEFKSLRSECEALSPHLFREDLYFTFDWFYAHLFFRYRKPEKPFIIQLTDNGRTVGVVPLALASKGRLFNLRSLEIIGSVQSPLRGCLIHQDYAERAAEFLAGLFFGKLSDVWDYIWFEGCAPGDPFVKHMEKCLEQKGLGVHREKLWGNVVKQIAEGTTAQDYLTARSRIFRKSLKRAIKNLTNNGEWTIVLYRRPDQHLQTAFDHYYQVFKDSWRDARDPQFHRKLGTYLAEKEMTRLFVLYYRPHADSGKPPSPSKITTPLSEVEDGVPPGPDMVPIAVDLSVVMGDTVAMLRTAYRQSYGHLSAGRLLLWFVIKHYLDQGDIRLVDFGGGEEEYKMSWGEVRECRIRLESPNPHSLKARAEFAGVRYIRPRLIPLVHRARNSRDRLWRTAGRGHPSTQ